MVELSLYPMYNRRNLNGLDLRPCVLLKQNIHSVFNMTSSWHQTYLPSSLKCWTRCYKWDSLSLLNRFSKSYQLGCFSVFPPIQFYEFYSFSLFFKFFKNSFCVSYISPPISLPNLAIASKNQMIIKHVDPSLSLKEGYFTINTSL